MSSMTGDFALAWTRMSIGWFSVRTPSNRIPTSSNAGSNSIFGPRTISGMKHSAMLRPPCV